MSTENAMKVTMANLRSCRSQYVFTFFSRRTVCLPLEVREVVVHVVVFLFTTSLSPVVTAAKDGEINSHALSHNHFIFRNRNP